MLAHLGGAAEGACAQATRPAASRPRTTTLEPLQSAGAHAGPEEPTEPNG